MHLRIGQKFSNRKPAVIAVLLGRKLIEPGDLQIVGKDDIMGRSLCSGKAIGVEMFVDTAKMGGSSCQLFSKLDPGQATEGDIQRLIFIDPPAGDKPTAQRRPVAPPAKQHPPLTVMHDQVDRDQWGVADDGLENVGFKVHFVSCQLSVGFKLFHHPFTALSRGHRVVREKL